MSEELLDTRVLNTSYIRPNVKRAQYAQLLILMILILDVLSIFSSWMQLDLLHDLNLGIIPEENVLDSNDLREAMLGYIYVAVFIISVVTFLNWFRRAYYNLSKRIKTKYTEGWAAGAWFIPILSLFRPVQMMTEMWTETTALIVNKGGNDDGKKALISIWWTLWVISSFLGNYVRRSANNASSVDDFIFSTKTDMALSIIGIPLAIVTIVLIKAYAQKEEELAKLELNEVDYSETVPELIVEEL